MNVISAANGVKHNTRKKLTYEIRFLSKKKDDFFYEKKTVSYRMMTSHQISFENVENLLKLTVDKIYKKFHEHRNCSFVSIKLCVTPVHSGLKK